MNLDETAENESNDRFPRFVTCSQNDNDNETISDEDFCIVMEGLYSFACWGPLYCKQRREEFEGYLHNENLIKLTGDSWLRTRLKLAKLISNFVSIESEKSLRLLQLPLKTDIEKHFNLDDAKGLCERMSVESWRDHELERSILKRRYPLISYYTSQKGFMLWFNRNSPISVYTYENQREAQYCERDTKDPTKSVLEKIAKHWFQPSGNFDQIKLFFVSQYRLYFLKLISNWFTIEYRNLSLNQPNLNFYGHVYRGEVMKEEEFQNLLQKLKFTKESRLLGGFLVSTSQNERVAKRFFQQSVQDENMVRVIHKVLIPPPCVKTIDEFQQEFPHEHLVNNALSIQKLSRISGEKEVLLSTLQTFITNIYQDTDDIWHIESVSCNSENTVAMECAMAGDKIEQYRQYQQHRKSEDKEGFYQFLTQHPDFLAWNINKLRCRWQGAIIASRQSSRSSQYHHHFDEIIVETFEQYSCFKNHHQTLKNNLTN